MEPFPTTEKQSLGFFTYSYSMFPGLWEIPLVMWNDLQGRTYPNTAKTVYRKFKSHIPRNETAAVTAAVTTGEVSLRPCIARGSMERKKKILIVN